jgi:transposase-like protein
MDGIYLSRQCVILIACTDEYVIDWYVARSEHSASWAALMGRIPAPDVAICDGGTGFEKARRQMWPSTRVQRCVFHAFCQVKRYTTANPKLSAGIELYALAKELLHIKDIEAAAKWIANLSSWNTKWTEFLSETSFIDNRRVFTHDRLIKAKNSLNRLVSNKTLFTYLDPDLNTNGAVPATNNKIEGAVNAELRRMLRRHNGLRLERRIKAVSWWCYMHTEEHLSAPDILKYMPKDKDIDGLYKQVYKSKHKDDGSPGWGDGVVWSEFHTSDPFRVDYD